MNLTRVFTWLAGMAAWVLALCAYAEYVYLLGFPDGYITELAAAERKLALVFIGVSVPWGAYLLFLGRIAAHRKVGDRFAVAVVLYLLFMLGAAVVDVYYQAHLADGSGG